MQLSFTLGSFAAFDIVFLYLLFMLSAFTCYSFLLKYLIRCISFEYLVNLHHGVKIVYDIWSFYCVVFRTDGIGSKYFINFGCIHNFFNNRIFSIAKSKE